MLKFLDLKDYIYIVSGEWKAFKTYLLIFDIPIKLMLQ
jgi:hypothetical protein